MSMRAALLAPLTFLGCATPADTGEPPSFDGVWLAEWSYYVDNWSTGTTMAQQCTFTGETTLAVGGALGSGNFWAQGMEHMICSNAETDLDYEYGGYIDPNGTISGHFYWWGEQHAISFAGSCSQEECSATGSDSFELTFTR